MDILIKTINDSAAAIETNSTTEQLHKTSWLQCSSGKLLQPLDILLYMFPVQRQHTGRYFCATPAPLTLHALSNLLPPPSKFFAPNDLMDTVVVSLATCLFITIAMVILKMVWEWVDLHFRSIQPAHKKWYVIACICKGILLPVVAFSPGFWRLAYNFIATGELNSLEILQLKRCAVVMVTPDLVALYMVPKLQKAKVIHHVVSGIVLLLINSIDYTTYEPYGLQGMCRMLGSYGLLVSIIFSVYAYLALRIVYPKASWLAVLVKLALLSYGCFCVFNLTLQSLWLLSSIATLHITLHTLFHPLAISGFAWADITLLHFLVKMNSLHTAANKKRKEQ